MAFVTDSNRPQRLWQPPATACLTASGAVSEVPYILMHDATGCNVVASLPFCIPSMTQSPWKRNGAIWKHQLGATTMVLAFRTTGLKTKLVTAVLDNYNGLIDPPRPLSAADLPQASTSPDMIGWSGVLLSHTLDAARSY